MVEKERLKSRDPAHHLPICQTATSNVALPRRAAESKLAATSNVGGWIIGLWGCFLWCFLWDPYGSIGFTDGLMPGMRRIGVEAFEHLDREIFALRGQETERLMLSTRVPGSQGTMG